jgi:hypothetical protein
MGDKSGKRPEKRNYLYRVKTMAEPFRKIDRFLGIDNTSDPTKLQIHRGGGIFLTEADNVDIDDENMVHRRKGWNELILAGAVHSAWSDGNVFLFVQGTDFKRLNKDYTVTILITSVDPTDRMCYVAVNDIVYFSNSSIVGYIEHGISYPFPDPDQTFKQRMVGGHILEYYNNRLYAALDSIIYHSDATILTRMDKRKNAIAAFSGRVKMMKAVVDGIYVSADGKTQFMAGDDPGEFVINPATDTEAIEGTAITVEGDDVGKGEVGRTVYWLSEDGVYKGYPGGAAVLMQGGRFAIEDLVQGAAILTNANGYQQYLAISELKAGMGGAWGEMTLPKPALTGAN